MCMILDADMWGRFPEEKKDKDLLPVRKWLEKQNGKLVYSDHEQFQKELTKDYKETLKGYFQSGKARFFPKKEVEREITVLRKNSNPKSNDLHILGLAKIAKVKVLCTGDKKLHQDFKDILDGSIYQKAEHRHLLTKDTCP